MATSGQSLLNNRRENENERNILIQNKDHFKSLKDLVRYEHLTDVTIKVGDKSFRAHKLILACTITYFDDYFRNSCANVDTIIIEDVNPESIISIIDYANTGTVNINEKNVFSLLTSVTILKISYLIRECQSFIIDDFESITRKNDYLDLNYKVFEALLECAITRMQTYKVFLGVMRWITHDYEQRKVHQTNLLSLLDFSMLSSDDINNYLFDETNGSIGNKYKELVSELHFRKYQSKNITKEIGEETDARKDSAVATSMNNTSSGLKEEVKQLASKKIYVVTLTGANIKIYEPAENTWTNIEMEKGNREADWFSCTAYNGRLYTFGGQENKSVSSKVKVFKPGTNIWLDIAPMKVARSESGATSLKDALYVCGGWTGTERTNAVERYSFETGKWEVILPMNQRRSSPAVVAFENRIYAIGGHEDQKCLDMVEVFDLESQKWSTLDAKMGTLHHRCGAAVLNGKIYVCGGYDSNDNLKSVEMFDPNLNAWTSVTSMNFPRFFFLLVAFSEKLWAIGGARKDEALVEVYDPSKDTWSCVEWSSVPRAVPFEKWLTGGVL